MIIEKDYKIISEIMIDSIDWEKIYNQTSEYSRKLFKKEEILNSIKRLILEYPYHFDTSYGRLESGTSVFSIRYGILNDYIYILSDYGTYTIKNGWFLTEEYFFSYLTVHKLNGKYYVCFNYKNLLRKLKLNKLKNKLNEK